MRAIIWLRNIVAARNENINSLSSARIFRNATILLLEIWREIADQPTRAHAQPFFGTIALVPLLKWVLLYFSRESGNNVAKLPVLTRRATSSIISRTFSNCIVIAAMTPAHCAQALQLLRFITDKRIRREGELQNNWNLCKSFPPFCFTEEIRKEFYFQVTKGHERRLGCKLTFKAKCGTRTYAITV